MRFFGNILIFIFLALSFGKALAQPVPSNVEFLDNFSQAGIFLLKSQTDKALQCYQRCIKLNPKSSSSYYQIAKIHYDSGDYAAGEMFAKNAVDILSQTFI